MLYSTKCCILVPRAAFLEFSVTNRELWPDQDKAQAQQLSVLQTDSTNVPYIFGPQPEQPIRGAGQKDRSSEGDNVINS